MVGVSFQALIMDKSGAAAPASLTMTVARALLFKQLGVDTYNADLLTVSYWVKINDTATIIQPFLTSSTTPTASTSGSLRFVNAFNQLNAGDVETFNVSAGNVVTAGQITAGGQGIMNGSWHHFVCAIDSGQATETDRVKMWKDNSLLTDSVDATWSSGEDANVFVNSQFLSFGNVSGSTPGSTWKMAFFDLVEASAPDPTNFAFSNGGTWTRKPYTGSYGNHGYGWDGSNGFNTTSGVIGALTANNVTTGSNLDFVDLPPFT